MAESHVVTIVVESQRRYAEYGANERLNERLNLWEAW